MLYTIIRKWYGDIPKIDAKKFLLLALAFFFTIGSYWLLRGLKDGLFFDLVSPDMQPRAKQLSLLVVLGLVLIYSKLVDMVERHKLFYILGFTYLGIFLILSTALRFPALTGPWIGWVAYFAIESFGSLVVAHFWSFVASITNPQMAKIGFPIIVAGAQAGGVVGPALAYNAESIGSPNLFLIACVAIALMIGVIVHFMRVIPASALNTGSPDTASPATSTKEEKTGFLEGLRLIITRPYLLGIFGVVAINEILTTIIDYQMKLQAKAVPAFSTQEGFTSFLGFFGMCTNIISLAAAILGTGYILRRFGLLTCLLTFPVILGASLGVLYYLFSFAGWEGPYLLWATVGVMVLAKGLNYALANVSKDMMYVPTSKDVKFKSKSWIDVFGSRSAKAGGAVINDALIGPIALMFGLTKLTSMMSFGTLIALVFVAIWAVVAVLVGRYYNRLVKANKIVE